MYVWLLINGHPLSEGKGPVEVTVVVAVGDVDVGVELLSDDDVPFVAVSLVNYLVN